jgi:hypothetical protein
VNSLTRVPSRPAIVTATVWADPPAEFAVTHLRLVLVDHEVVLHWPEWIVEVADGSVAAKLNPSTVTVPGVWATAYAPAPADMPLYGNKVEIVGESNENAR